MEEILHQLRWVVYLIIYKALYIPGGWLDFFQPYVRVPSLKLTAKAPENRGPLEKEIPIGNYHF